jgi:hypothetical protein
VKEFGEALLCLCFHGFLSAGGQHCLGSIFSFFLIRQKEQKENQSFNNENRTEAGGINCM